MTVVRHVVLRLFTLLAILLVGAAMAQQPSALVNELVPEIDTLSGRVDTAEVRFLADRNDDERLAEIRSEMERLDSRLAAARDRANSRLNEINTRLEQIGPAPPEGEASEAPAATQERSTLQREKSEVNALIGRADDLKQRMNALTDQIATTRRQLFTSTLSRRYDVGVALGPQVLNQAADEAAELYERVSSWLRFIGNNRLGPALLATFGSLAAAFILLLGGRRAFARLWRTDPSIEDPSYLARVSVAFWTTLLKSAALSAFLVFTYYSFSYLELFRSDIDLILITVFRVIATVYFINRLAYSALSPGLPNWRLVAMEGAAARKLYWLVCATSVIIGLDFIVNRINEVQSSPLSLLIAKSLLATVLVGGLLILISLVKPYRNEDGTARSWSLLFRFLLRAIGVLTIGAALLGYIGMARFISQQAVITSALLAAMYIGFLSARAVSDFGALAETSLGRWLGERFDLNEQTKDQLGLLASIVINCLVVLIGIPLILLQWGFQWGDIYAIGYRFGSEVSIGSIRISLLGILLGIAIFILGYFLTRWFQSWLDDSVMARGRVDAGVRNSIRTIAGYAGIAVALLIGLSVAGINLSNLALIAGALSLGIGFGLQNIVSNFVSGLILLAERPFKVGDLIVAGGFTGNVRRINVRATEIETAQKQIVILPNSELINAAVTNWTHRNNLGRIEIPVGVSLDSDPRRVHALLDEIANAHPSVLKNPRPAVSFTGFGPSSLDFAIYLFLADITSSLAIVNEIRFTIVERFREEGISMAQPRNELIVGEWEREEILRPRTASKDGARRKRPEKPREE